MNTKKIILVIILTYSFFGCNINEASEQHKNDVYKTVMGQNIIYYNSFETDKDTTGFTGVNPEMFVNDPVESGGNKSLLIGGGCVQPTGSISIKIRQEGIYCISFWAKTRDRGGAVDIRESDRDLSFEKSVGINEKEWTYKVIDNVYCSSNSTLIIDLWVGGLVYASVNLDEFKVTRSFKRKAEKINIW